MPDRWFRIPQTGNGTPGDPYRPDHVHSMADIHGYSGNKYRNQSSRWVVRVYGTESALDSLAAENDVTELTRGEAADHLNSMANTPDGLSADEWESSVYVDPAGA